MSNSKWFAPIVAVLVGFAIVFGLIYFLGDQLLPQGLGGSGVTNMDSLTLSNDLIVTDDADVGGDLSFGANDLYAVGYATEGQQLIYGTDLITGTAVAAHGLTTVTFCSCALGEDPETGAGDSALCSVAVSANVCTVKAWQDDFTASTEVDTVIQWLVVGAP